MLYMMSGLLAVKYSKDLDPIEANAWILKMEKFFDAIDCFEDQKASYTSIMINNKINY